MRWILAVLALGAGVALAAPTETKLKIVKLEEVARVEPGTTLVFRDKAGSTIFIEDGIVKVSAVRANKAKRPRTPPIPPGGSPAGVCGGDTSVSCEEANYYQSCKKDGAEGVQACKQWHCKCLASDRSYTAAGSPMCGGCITGNNLPPVIDQPAGGP